MIVFESETQRLSGRVNSLRSRNREHIFSFL